MSLGKLLKNIAPVLIGATLGPGIGQTFGASPFISRAVTGALTSKLTGGKTKDALRNALIAGVGGVLLINLVEQNKLFPLVEREQLFVVDQLNLLLAILKLQKEWV